MRTIVALKVLLILTLCVAVMPVIAQPQDRSDKYVAHLGKKILDRIHENEALIRNGEGATASYLIMDVPSADDPHWFFSSFTDPNALQLWLNRGWITQAILGMDISVQTNSLNKYIDELRNYYLSNTKYKDQKIYFVVSGIYNYDNIDEDDKVYNWSDMRSVSFDSAVKEKTGNVGFSDRESVTVNRILSKIKEDKKNTELKTIIDNEDYIICFIFNLYKYFPETKVVAEYTVPDNNLAASGLNIREVSLSTPRTFIIDGYFFSRGVDQDIIKNVQSFVSTHTSGVGSAVDATSESRNNYLSEFIKNVFLSFSPITASTTCASDVSLRDKLEALYSKGVGEGTLDISESLTDLSVDTRICLLHQLAGDVYCGDGNNWFFRLGKCENLILDIVKSTPANQRRPLLDYLNDNNTVLKQLISKLHDEGPGTENYSTFILTLSQYAYEAYAKDFSVLNTGAGYCSFLTYNPTKDYAVLANYNDDNNISFSFAAYDGPCYTQVWDANGDISYLPEKRTLKPFEFIGIIPEVELPVKLSSNGASQSVKGKKFFVPAVMLYWNIKRTNTKEAIKSIEIAANAASFFMGLGEVKLTGTVLGKVLLSAEGTTTLANLVANSDAVKQAILKKEGGVEFIETIGTINNLSGLSTIGYLGLSKLGRAVKFWNANKGDLLATNMLEFDRIGLRMNDLEGGMVKDGFIFTKGAKPPDGLGLTGIFKVFSKAQLESLEPIIDQAVSNIIRDGGASKFTNWSKTNKAVVKLMGTITTGDLVELPAKDFLLKSLKGNEEMFLNVHLQYCDAAGVGVGGQFREIDVLQFNRSTKLIEKGITIKLDEGKILKEGVPDDRNSLKIISQIPDNGSELRQFVTDYKAKNPKFNLSADKIAKIEKVQVVFFELTNNTGKPIKLAPSEFNRYLGNRKDFLKFPIDGISPETLGVRKEQLIEGTLELIKRKLQQ